MDLATRYLGLPLPHPFIPGASPFTQDLDMVMRLEDAGAPALVMHSLFEEDLVNRAPSRTSTSNSYDGSSAGRTCRSSHR